MFTVLRLKGIEMQGFKSFADRTTLSFDDGLTAIVGPNGSGKSNVSDAIRWVFGEQSVKSLRGAKMEDVIFSGTQSRKSQGYCTVALTIDNTDRAVDIDCDEITIARKLYRTGDSEYKINGNSVRLRDINEMFMDTGLGRDGYSIIEQGKIADIISSKSHQRREIFEEAAGISKYRYKKHEANRHLNAAQENLLRLKDILHELEGRVEPLRLQAEKAEKFLCLANEKKELELSLWVIEIADIGKNLRELEDKILVRISEKDSIDSAISQLDKELDECEMVMQQLSVYMEKCRARLLELNNNISDTQTKISELSSSASYKDAMADSIAKRLEDFGLDAEQVEVKLSELFEKKAELLNELNTVLDDTVKITDELAMLREKQSGVDSTSTLIKQSIEELNISRSKAMSDRNTNIALVQETADRLNSLIQNNELQEIEKISGELAQAQSFLKKLESELESLSNTQGGYDFKISSKVSMLEDIDKKIFALEKKSSEKLQRSQLLSDLDKSMEGYSGSVKYVLSISNAIGGLHGTLGSLINVDRDYAVAIEIALGATIGNLVVDDEQSAKRYVSALKKSSSGRATFLPISTVSGKVMDYEDLVCKDGFVAVASELVECGERFRGIVNWTLGRTIVAENLDYATEIGHFCRNKYRIVTLDGQLVNAGGSITGGSVGKSGYMLSRRAEIEQLNAEASAILSDVADIELKRKSLDAEIFALKAERQGIVAEIQTIKDDILTTTTHCKSLSSALEQSHLRAGRVKEQVEYLNSRIFELDSDNKSLDDSILVFNTEYDELVNKLTELQNEGILVAERCTVLDSEIKEKEFARLSLEKDIDILNNEISRIEEKQTSDTQLKTQLEYEMNTLREEAYGIRVSIQQSDELIAEHKKNIADIQQDIEQKRAELFLKEKQSAELRAKERQFGGQRDTVSQDLGKLEERKRAVLHENDELVRRLFDEYELTLSEAKSQAVVIEDKTTANRQLLELKAKLRAMGNINVSAIEEYKEVKSRYEFMSGQFNDAKASRDSLIELIEQLSTDMSNMFVDKFEKISIAFKEIFYELFGGGRANLWLDEPNLPLESSIEIEVQPPGKLIKNLSSLSGGEQAMVAICIYFAILSVSPSPFVLIDEIEAALDDVNVARFANYITRLTKNTQFISITHRRGTMEQADVLYGVTMEEKGVSKLLKLDVAQLEEKLRLNLV